MAIKNVFPVDGIQTEFKTTFGATSKDLIDIKLFPGGIIDRSEFTVDGLADSSDELTINYPGAADLDPNVVTELTVILHTSVDENDPDASMLTDFNAADFLSRQAIQNEYRRVYRLYSILAGDADLANIDLGTAESTLANTNSIAATLFTTPTLDGDGNWDGSNVLPAPLETLYPRVDDLETNDAAQDVTLDNHEGRITTNEQDIGLLGQQVQSGVGLPTPVIDGQVLLGQPANQVTWSDLAALPEILAKFDKAGGTITGPVVVQGSVDARGQVVDVGALVVRNAVGDELAQIFKGFFSGDTDGILIRGDDTNSGILIPDGNDPATFYWL
jgi:hypothetical protein